MAFKNISGSGFRGLGFKSFQYGFMAFERFKFLAHLELNVKVCQIGASTQL